MRMQIQRETRVSYRMFAGGHIAIPVRSQLCHSINYGHQMALTSSKATSTVNMAKCADCCSLYTEKQSHINSISRHNTHWTGFVAFSLLFGFLCGHGHGRYIADNYRQRHCTTQMLIILLRPRMCMHGRPFRFSRILSFFRALPRRLPNGTQPNFTTCSDIGQI